MEGKPLTIFSFILDNYIYIKKGKRKLTIGLTNVVFRIIICSECLLNKDLFLLD